MAEDSGEYPGRRAGNAFHGVFEERLHRRNKRDDERGGSVDC